MNFIVPDWSLEFVKYFLVGATAALVDWLAFFLLLHFAPELNYLIDVAIAFLVATYVNYWLCIRYVFGSGRHGAVTTFGLLYIVSGIGMCLDMSFVWGLVQLIGMPMMPSKVISTGLVFFWNFGARKAWVF